MRVQAHGGKRVVLRPYRKGDWSRWRQSYLEANVSVTTKKFRQEAFAAKVEQHREGMRQDLYYALGLFDHEGRHLGAFDLYILARLDMQMANVGYWLQPQHRGQGYATEGLALAMQVGFDDLRLQRIEAAIEPTNKKSIRLARRAGMIREGIRASWSWNEKEWADHLVYYLLGTGAAPRVRPTLRSALRWRREP